VRHFAVSSIFCLQFNEDLSLLFAGLEDSVDALCPSTFETLFHISAHGASVWSISVCPGENAIVLGTQGNGILVVKLRTNGKDIPRSQLGRDPYDTVGTMQARRFGNHTHPDDIFSEIHFLIAEIGTCSAISHALNGSCYAASNNSRIYHFRNAGEVCSKITSRIVALPKVESGDFHQMPRRDIYDVLCISNNLFGDLQKPSARLEKGFDALCLSTFAWLNHLACCRSSDNSTIVVVCCTIVVA
jgi:hypothetical protein